MFPFPKILKEIQRANHCGSGDLKILRALCPMHQYYHYLSQDRPNILPLFQGLLEATARPNTPANINRQVNQKLSKL